MRRIAKEFLSLLLFVLLFSSIAAGASPVVPTEFGEVIFSRNEKSPGHLFIVGLSHRDSLTRLNHIGTPKVQIEVYKIGDWLIHHQGTRLLVPEGFFTGKPVMTEGFAPSDGVYNDCPMPDDPILEGILADDKKFVNAEMLLKKHHELRLHQVEDLAIYNDVRKAIQRLSNCKSEGDYLTLKSELDYLQAKRTAAMLQRIPGAIDEEYGHGNIRNRKAIFTIGLSHLPKIIRYLNENKITISSPPEAAEKYKDYLAELNLLKESFGVSIIIPATLAKDSRILEMNGLGKIIAQSRKSTLP
jgi:hypothetical protein